MKTVILCIYSGQCQGPRRGGSMLSTFAIIYTLHLSNATRVLPCIDSPCHEYNMQQYPHLYTSAE